MLDVEEIKPGKYRHYKGGEYRVIGRARPKKMFLESVVVDGKEVARFVKIA